MPTSREGQPLRTQARHQRAHILYAAENWAYASDSDDDMPAQQFVLGFDRSGRLLELAILTFDSGYQFVITI